MKVLYIGGNGNISWYCTKRALEKGYEVWHLNRGQSRQTRRDVPKEVHWVRGDINCVPQLEEALEGMWFDVVVDFLPMSRAHAKNMIRLFHEKTGHFFVISSDAVYKRKPCMLPFKENSELYKIGAPKSDYINGKLEVEEEFLRAWSESEFPVTIIRPSHTYDTIIPICIGHNCYTAIYKLEEGLPLLLAGDGSALRTFTHSRDFADALVGLFKIPDISGEVFHIASNELLTWKEQTEIILKTLNKSKSLICPIPIEDALNFEGIQEREMNVQRFSHYVFDVHKIERYVQDWLPRVSFEEGIKETFSWLQEKQIRMRRVPRVEKALDVLYEKYCYR